MYGFEYERPKLPNGLRITVLRYLLVATTLVVRRQAKQILDLKSKIKTSRQAERDELAATIFENIQHSVDYCGNTCDAHTIVKYIKALK